MLTICNTIASEQATPTEAVKAHAVRLLQYAARFPNNAIVFNESKMHLIIQADASFNSRPKGRSVAGGIAYCGDVDDPTKENGMLHAISSIIDVVCASAGEAEYGSAYINAQCGVGLRHILIALGHPQPPTPILCDNEFAIGLATDTIKQRKSKSIDLRFHWIRDRIRQGQFTIHHLPGDQINISRLLHQNTVGCQTSGIDASFGSNPHHQPSTQWLAMRGRRAPPLNRHTMS
jgi:hypothetical protein